jgi:uncharacterized membrane protein YbhN (UPF0104 family)
VLWFFIAWAWGTLEVALILHACGHGVDFAQCLAIESLAAFVDAVFFFVPGQLGTREGGLVGIAYCLGLDKIVGLKIGLVRRCRVLVWAAIGLLCLAWFRRRPALEDRAGETGDSVLQTTGDPVRAVEELHQASPGGSNAVEDPSLS